MVERQTPFETHTTRAASFASTIGILARRPVRADGLCLPAENIRGTSSAAPVAGRTLWSRAAYNKSTIQCNMKKGSGNEHTHLRRHGDRQGWHGVAAPAVRVGNGEPSIPSTARLPATCALPTHASWVFETHLKSESPNVPVLRDASAASACAHCAKVGRLCASSAQQRAARASRSSGQPSSASARSGRRSASGLSSSQSSRCSSIVRPLATFDAWHETPTALSGCCTGAQLILTAGAETKASHVRYPSVQVKLREQPSLTSGIGTTPPPRITLVHFSRSRGERRTMRRTLLALGSKRALSLPSSSGWLRPWKG